MTATTFVQLAIGLIMALSALITAYVLPYIQTKIDATKMQQVYEFAKKCVLWANQTIPADMWKEKKEQVTELVKNFIADTICINLTDEEIDAIIEAFVIECKKGI